MKRESMSFDLDLVKSWSTHIWVYHFLATSARDLSFPEIKNEWQPANSIPLAFSGFRRRDADAGSPDHRAASLDPSSPSPMALPPPLGEASMRRLRSVLFDWGPPMELTCFRLSRAAWVKPGLKLTMPYAVVGSGSMAPPRPWPTAYSSGLVFFGL